MSAQRLSVQCERSREAQTGTSLYYLSFRLFLGKLFSKTLEVSHANASLTAVAGCQRKRQKSLRT
jgi:hypothetical protein